MQDASRYIRQCVDRAARMRTGGQAISLLAVVMAASALTVFLSTAEDVIHRDGIVRRDPAFLQLFTHFRTTPVVDAAKVITEFGSVLALGIVAAVGGFVLWRTGYRLGHAIAPTLAFALSILSVGMLKSVIGRHRPPVSLHLVAESDLSFPSGHATDSAAVLMTIALVVAVVTLRRPLARIGTVLMAGLLVASIGFSRLVLGVHWPTDVVGGWALGTGIALAVVLTALFLTRPPSVAAHGATGSLRRLQCRLHHVLARQRPVTP